MNSKIMSARKNRYLKKIAVFALILTLASIGWVPSVVHASDLDLVTFSGRVLDDEGKPASTTINAYLVDKDGNVHDKPFAAGVSSTDTGEYVLKDTSNNSSIFDISVYADDYYLVYKVENVGVAGQVSEYPGYFSANGNNEIVKDFSITTHGNVYVHITDMNDNDAPAGVPMWFSYVSPAGSNWPYNAPPSDGVSPEQTTNDSGIISMRLNASWTYDGGSLGGFIYAFPAGDRDYGGALQTSALRYDWTTMTDVSAQAGKDRHYDIKVKPLGQITTRLEDSVTGDVISGAYISYTSADPTDESNQHNINKYNEGASVYALGPVTISVNDPDNPGNNHLGHESAGTTVSPIPWGQVPVTLKLVPHVPGEVTGTVYDMGDNPVSGATVKLLWDEWGGEGGLEGGHYKTIKQTTTGADGSYRFTGVVPTPGQRYVLRASKALYRASLQGDVRVASGETTAAGDFFLVAADGVCEINGTSYATLDEALAVVRNGETITLLKDITDNGGMVIDNGKSFTIDLNGSNLSVSNSGDMAKGLEVINGSAVALDESSGGSFNVFGSVYGVYADDATVTVSNVSAGDADNGGVAVMALNGANITVTGDVEANQIGAEVNAISSVINIGGNVTARGTDNDGAGFFCYGALTSEGEMNIDGNISAVSGTGIRSTGGGELTLEGTITAAHYIEFGFGLDNTIKAKEDKEAITGKAGYDTYTDGNGTVWVKAAAATVVTGISVKAQPADLTYTAGETLDLSGLAVTLTYNNSATLDVAYEDFNSTNITANPANGTVMEVATHNNQPVTVSCNGHTAYTNPLTVTQPPSHDDGHSGGGGSDTKMPAYNASLSGSGSSTTLGVTVNAGTNNAAVSLGVEQGGSISGIAEGENAIISVPSIPGVDNYTLSVPANYLSTPDGNGTLTLDTNVGSIVTPDNMLAGIPGTEGKTAGITIGQGDKSELSDEAREAIGSRPLIQLTLTLDGKQTDWNNPDAPLTVSIPYTPTAAELANPESIVIWYIDGSGNPVSVPNGYYDPATGTVTFTTTHFSGYAVGYHQVSFTDVPSGAWHSKPVGFIAARGITTGTGSGNFSPDAKLTRGEFIVMMMKAYGIEPDTDLSSNFSDAGSTYYTGYLAAAKRLEISGGIGGNMFAPGKEITRQEMFTLLHNALKVIDGLPEGTSGKPLSSFTDAGQIASWAKEAMALFTETGIVGGSNGKLSPTVTTTRAEMAQVLYNLLLK